MKNSSVSVRRLLPPAFRFSNTCSNELMKFSKPDADIFVPSGKDADEALGRTTHLCIAAHQDDIEIFAYHGIAECFRRKERSFTGVVVTNGAGSPRSGPYADCSDGEMQEIRQIEQRNAAAIGGYGLQLQLRFSSSEVKQDTEKHVQTDLRQILERAQPEILYLHNPFDKHDTHVAVFLRTMEAIRTLPAEKRPKCVLGGEVWRDLDWVPDDAKIALPVDQYESLSAALLGVFDSQISGGKRYDLATAGRRVANATFSQSHATDISRAVSWAIDLTPMTKEGGPDVEEFVNDMLNRFCEDVSGRIGKFA